MKIIHIETKRTKQIHVVCHDAPITLRGKRYKKLIISCCDLWWLANPLELMYVDPKKVYPLQYELMIFARGWRDVYCDRARREYNLGGVLKELIRGVYK